MCFFPVWFYCYTLYNLRSVYTSRYLPCVPVFYQIQVQILTGHVVTRHNARGITCRINGTLTTIRGHNSINHDAIQYGHLHTWWFVTIIIYGYAAIIYGHVAIIYGHIPLKWSINPPTWLVLCMFGHRCHGYLLPAPENEGTSSSSRIPILCESDKKCLQK